MAAASHSSSHPVPDSGTDLPRPVVSALAAGRVLVIVPAHNEEASLRLTLSHIRQELPKARIVVVNDCSTDRTADVARAEGAEVINLSCNLGYGGAVQAGFKYAINEGYDFVLQMDADGQHDPRSAAALLCSIVLNEADVSVGSRFLGQADYKIPILRRLGMTAFSFVVKLASGRSITDPTSGFQAMNATAVRFFERDNYPCDFPDADTIILLLRTGFRVHEVPVSMVGRKGGTSMHSNSKALYYVLKMMLSIFVIFLRRRDLVRRDSSKHEAADGNL